MPERKESMNLSRKFCLFGFLTILTFPTNADLVEVSRNKNKIFFVETGMIIPHVAGRRMTKELHEFVLKRADGVTSLRIKSEYDCDRMAYRDLARDEIAGELGVGMIVSLTEKPTKWKQVSEGSGRKQVFDFVCSYATED